MEQNLSIKIKKKEYLILCFLVLEQEHIMCSKVPGTHIEKMSVFVKLNLAPRAQCPVKEPLPMLMDFVLLIQYDGVWVGY